MVLVLAFKAYYMTPKTQAGMLQHQLTRNYAVISQELLGNVQICHGSERVNMTICLCDRKWRYSSLPSIVDVISTAGSGRCPVYMLAS